MPRRLGSRNCQEYKYKVEKLNEETTEVESTHYYITQREIQNEYNLKRSAVYFIINNPKSRKTNDYIKIYKLETPRPVYFKEYLEEDEDIIIRYTKIDY
tara:strand:+ start:220 stop:516 length:297 start_codon:yes stop_codon:yes gene_type:complete